MKRAFMHNSCALLVVLSFVLPPSYYATSFPLAFFYYISVFYVQIHAQLIIMIIVYANALRVMQLNDDEPFMWKILEKCDKRFFVVRFAMSDGKLLNIVFLKYGNFLKITIKINFH